MLLYHGSNMVVKNPEILYSGRALDFGIGFYLTSDFSQAEKWARLTTKRRGTGEATVTVFEIDESFSDLLVYTFSSANVEWLRYVSANRKNKTDLNDYDIIIGPAANDNTMPVLNFYLTGVYDENEAIKRLLPQKLKDQYVMKTDKAIKSLKCVDVILV